MLMDQRELARERSKRSYDRNKIKNARRRILNAIDKGRCVLERTLYDPKYQWSDNEKAMMIKCLDNRRKRYLINPKDITFIRDKRFRKMFPTDNYKEYHLEQKKALVVLENKLNKLKKLLEKVDKQPLRNVLIEEINDIEEQIVVNPLETRPSPVINPNDVPFRTPSPSPNTPKTVVFNTPNIVNTPNTVVLNTPYPNNNTNNTQQKNTNNTQQKNTNTQQNNSNNTQQKNTNNTQQKNTNTQQKNTNNTQQKNTNTQQKNTNTQQKNTNTRQKNTNTQQNNSNNRQQGIINSSRKPKISVDDVLHTYRYIIDNDILYVQRNKQRKEAGFKAFSSTIKNFFYELFFHNTYPTNDLMDVYKHPSRYADITKNDKKKLNILFKLHNLSCLKRFQKDIISRHIVNLCNEIPNIRDFNENFSIIQNDAKKAEEYRQFNDPYYDWEEIKKIPLLISGDSLRELKDLILVKIYVEANVVRDNLGLLRIVYTEPTQKVDYDYIMKKNQRYEISLNDFKNWSNRGTYTFQLNSDISNLIDRYLIKFQEHLDKLNGRKATFLFSKEDGLPYNDGKLSKYIVSMFKKYTHAKNLGINQLRHSVATYYKDKPNEFKSKLAYKMQHSLTQHIKYERYSDKVIKLPVFDPNFNKNDYDSILSRDPYVNKEVSITRNKHVKKGKIHLDKNNFNKQKPYRIIFDKPPPYQSKLYSAAEIYLILNS